MGEIPGPDATGTDDRLPTADELEQGGLVSDPALQLFAFQARRLQSKPGKAPEDLSVPAQKGIFHQKTAYIGVSRPVVLLEEPIDDPENRFAIRRVPVLAKSAPGIPRQAGGDTPVELGEPLRAGLDPVLAFQAG